MAEVRAIYKQKGSKNDPNNYRPICSPNSSRTLEKLIATQLYNYCDEHNILPPEQFGFRRHSSCGMALFAATDSWMNSVDKGSYAGALLIDLSKAFNTVPHQLLLTELRDIGCSIEALSWFRNYLSDRLQRVITFSNLQRIKRHIQYTEFYSARCSATMSSSDCTKRRKQQQQQQMTRLSTRLIWGLLDNPQMHTWTYVLHSSIAIKYSYIHFWTVLEA